MSKEITKVTPNLELPAYLKDQEVEGIDALKEYVRPPLLKIIQKQASDELLSRHDRGDTIVMPAEAIVATKDEPFFFVPLFFYTEWCTWGPIEMRGQVPPILERTADPASPIAMKARDPGLRTEDIVWGPDNIAVKDARHVEHLNFVVTLTNGHPLAGEPMIMGFARAEWTTGSKFASLIKLRHASIFCNVFQAQVGTRERAGNSWFGWDIANPAVDSGVEPWVPEDAIDGLRALHTDMKSVFSEGRLQTAYETVVEEDEAATDAVDAEF